MRQKAERQLPRVVIGFVLSALHLTFDMFVNSLSLTDCVSVMSVFGGIISTIHVLDVDSSSPKRTHYRIASVDSAQVVRHSLSTMSAWSSLHPLESRQWRPEEKSSSSPSASLRHLSSGAQQRSRCRRVSRLDDERHSKGRLT